VIAPAVCPAPPVDERDRIGREGVRAGLEDPGRVLLDMRSIEEYRGERVSPPWFEVDHGATCKGHIPGARHLYYNDLLEEEEKFMPLATLREKFLQAGATPDKEIVTYCRLSHRASMAWFILKYLLGYPRVRVYDGSWTEWGSIVGMPIVNQSLRQA
jgi:thiosulfate/3-mercaptopyruvate sulfurtransferase